MTDRAQDSIQTPAATATAGRQERLLVFNCHEAWVYQLGALGRGLDIVVGLKGRYKQGWDEQMRPIPRGARLVSLKDALASSQPYYCIIAHNISDLLDVKALSGPRLVVIHSTLEGRAAEERSTVPLDQMKSLMHKYLDMVGGHAVAVSRLKGASWGLADDIVPLTADPAAYLPYSGHLATGLRICNHIRSRKRILLWDLHEKAFSGLPVRLVGHNPDMPDVSASSNWSQLKELLSSHRFYIHTAQTAMEDGYNMATLEAMAAGMPILGNPHPTSAVEHGVNGFLSDDPQELRRHAELLLGDIDLARRMGQASREIIAKKFHISQFIGQFSQSIETARQRYAARCMRP